MSTTPEPIEPMENAVSYTTDDLDPADVRAVHAALTDLGGEATLESIGAAVTFGAWVEAGYLEACLLESAPGEGLPFALPVAGQGDTWRTRALWTDADCTEGTRLLRKRAEEHFAHAERLAQARRERSGLKVVR